MKTENVFNVDGVGRVGQDIMGLFRNKCGYSISVIECYGKAEPPVDALSTGDFVSTTLCGSS